MANRLSWRKYDLIRKREALVSPPAGTTQQATTPSRHHGSSTHLSAETKDAILQEAQSWSADKQVNWSELARSYDLRAANDGQTIKEFLRDNGIAAAKTNSTPNRSARRKRKRLPEDIPFPMQKPSQYHKGKLAELVESGKVANGSPVAPTNISSFTYDHQRGGVIERTTQVHARKHTLLEIRKKLLRKHEELGLIRGSYDNALSLEQLTKTLLTLGERVNPNTQEVELRSHYQEITTTRHLKIWHDHSTV